MKPICDIYLMERVDGSSSILKSIKIILKNFEINASQSYSEFLGLNLDRLTAVSIVKYFREKGIFCFGVPISYRNGNLLSFSDVVTKMEKNGMKYMVDFITIDNFERPLPPMFFSFSTTKVEGLDTPFQEGGMAKTLYIDRVDAHIWSYDDYREYLYDYNCLL